ncbi:unnamed protein product [Parnassius apollo]|uniref:(apollo) hypothetical protein n=1 Tax=Parnassius apollo TaxID=110799 RepID=A0A8S3XMZ3_PARAO|nr:unnamed protein product [Parnassius apollo]
MKACIEEYENRKEEPRRNTLKYNMPPPHAVPCGPHCGTGHCAPHCHYGNRGMGQPAPPPQPHHPPPPQFHHHPPPPPPHHRPPPQNQHPHNMFR